MGTQQQEIILAALDEHLERMKEIENPVVTFQLEERPKAWVEHGYGCSINAAYPHSEEPMEFLAKKGVSCPAELGVELDTWQPALYATFLTSSLKEGNVELAAEFIDRLFTVIHNLDSDYGTVKVEFREV